MADERSDVRSQEAALGPEFNYTIYIGKPVDAVWAALTEKALIDRYYLTPLFSLDLRPGGHIGYGGSSELITGEVLEVEAPKKLVHTFRFTDREEAASTVTYEVTAFGDAVSILALTHSGFGAESQTFIDISGGWPVIASSLKTLLETGETLRWPAA